MSFIEKDDIMQATNGGLDIILHYYPQGQNCVNNHKKFKLRNEKTPSATIKKMADGNYVVTDFGGDQIPRNAIHVVMDEENCDFGKAIKIIADKFGIKPANVLGTTEIIKPEIKQRAATPDELDGTWDFNFGDYTERDLRVIFSDQVIAYVQERCEKEINKGDDWQTRLSKLCKKYYMHKLESYTIVKDRKLTTISSTEFYPIFVFEIPAGDRTIRKIYQPLSADKARRFIYEPGKQPKDYIFGLTQCQRFYDDLNATKEAPQDEDAPEVREVKIPEIIWCTGGSDALNVAALDYQVVWLNSETAKLHGHQYNSISKLCDNFYTLPDIDATGVKSAHEVCMIYLDLRTIVLPASLSEKRDRRGNPCKDVRDYLRYYKRKDFDALVKAALPYKFWDEVPQFDKKGKFTGYNYEVNNTHLYWFLSQNGFNQFTNKNETDIYIRIIGNIVEEIDAKKVRRFITQFLAERNFDTKLRNMFYRTTQLNASSFENLPHKKIDFTDYDKESQWLFFANKTWQITPNGIAEHKAGNVNKYVWEKEVIKHNVKLEEDYFTIYQDAGGQWQIDVKDMSGMFFQFVEKTCRMHWRVDENGVDDGMGGLRKTYTEEEINEHKQHLINKIYALGYLLHKYKEPSSAFAVWAMENEVIEDSQSEGRSGKSIFMKFPKYFLRYEPIGARDQRITDNKHLLENVTEFTNYVLFDDCNEFINFGFFFPLITGPWNINPKNTRSFVLTEDDAPKIGFSSNFAPKVNDSSTLDRLVFVVFSDYYHSGPNEKFPERRTPKDDFGINLFNDFSEDEWNKTYNFGAQCIKAYLNIQEKLNPPMSKVTQRQLLGEMGDTFKAWADVYFSSESSRLNTFVVKEDAFEDFRIKNNVKWTSQKFGKSIRAWCKFYNYVLNPKEHCNDKGRIIHKVGDSTKEMIYIEPTAANLLHNINLETKPTKDLPF